MNQTALIVGASRGLGPGLTAEYLSRMERHRHRARRPGRWGAERPDGWGAFDHRASRRDLGRGYRPAGSEVARPLDLLFINAGIMGLTDRPSASAGEIAPVTRIAANAGAHEHRFIGWNGLELPW